MWGKHKSQKLQSVLPCGCHCAHDDADENEGVLCRIWMVEEKNVKYLGEGIEVILER